MRCFLSATGKIAIGPSENVPYRYRLQCRSSTYVKIVFHPDLTSSAMDRDQEIAA